MSTGLTGPGNSATSVFTGGGADQIRLPAAVRRREAIVAYSLLAPSIILFLTFVAGPMFGAIALSFYDWDLFSKRDFVGLKNYQTLVQDSEARQAFLNTLFFGFWSLVTHIGGGLLLALAVQRSVPTVLKYLFRTTVFFPVVMSWATVSLIWKYILDPNFGFINYYLKQLGIPTRSWLLSPETAMPAIIFVDLWKTVGFTFIILLAGLQGVPSHLYEAAKIDGAGAWRRFIDVTIPMLSPTLFLTAILSFIGALQIFEPMFIMTNGGPLGSTVSIMQKIYETGFREFRMGYASAMAIAVFLIILIVTLIQMRISKYWVFYE